MNKTTSMVAIAATAVFLSGCNHLASVDTTKAEVKTNPEKAMAVKYLDEANTANSIVATAGFDWNVTHKLLKKAKKDLKAGKYQASIKKSKKARAFALIGLEQMETSKTAGPRLTK